VATFPKSLRSFAFGGLRSVSFHITVQIAEEVESLGLFHRFGGGKSDSGRYSDEGRCWVCVQVGAFYPFSRDHSGSENPQEYYEWKSVAEAARFVYSWRYRLLPFLYTLMYGAHKTGAPLVRPLFFAAPEDPRTWNIGDQFLLGTDILVSPVLQAGQVAVRPYFPKGVWYNLFDPKLVVHATNQSFHSLDAPLDTINVHVRAGAIVPMQEPAWTTAEARRTPFTLLVALAPESASASAVLDIAEDQVDIAEGELFVDDDDELQMEVKAGTATYVKYQAVRSRGRYVLTGEVTEGAYALAQGLTLQTVSVLGAQASPASSSVLVNGKVGAATTVQFNTGDSSLTINNLNLPIGKNFQVTWDSTSSDPHLSKI
jgi:alpha-D-xyloside xylohydrolase